MTLTTLIILYALPGLVVAHIVGGQTAWHMKVEHYQRPELVDYAAGAFGGLVAGAVWPLTTFVALVHLAAKRLIAPTATAADLFLYRPKEHRENDQELRSTAKEERKQKRQKQRNPDKAKGVVV